MASPGDRGKVASEPETVLPNSQLPIISMALPIIPMAHTDKNHVAPVAGIDPPGLRDGYEDHSHGQSSTSITWRPDKCRILLLCGGPDDRSDSLAKLFKAAGFECCNYDIANGPQFDIVDDSVWDALFSDASSMEYVACMASPPCGPMSKLHSLPGPPPLFAVDGPGRYGRRDLSPRSKERARTHILIITRVLHQRSEL